MLKEEILFQFSQGPRWTPGGQFAPQALGQSHSSSVSNPRQEAYKGRVDAMQSMMVYSGHVLVHGFGEII